MLTRPGSIYEEAWLTIDRASVIIAFPRAHDGLDHGPRALPDRHATGCAASSIVAYNYSLKMNAKYRCGATANLVPTVIARRQQATHASSLESFLKQFQTHPNSPRTLCRIGK
jgi:hypothetical protein